MTPAPIPPRGRAKPSEQGPKQQRGRWKPGESGNPGGRPKVALEWKARCRKFLEEDGGWERLISIAQSPEPSEAMPALKLIAEYAYGRPTQNVGLFAEHAGKVVFEVVYSDPESDQVPMRSIVSRRAPREGAA